MFAWTDPDEGDTWEFRYIVTQTEEEGPEFMLFRKQGTDAWHEWPMFVEPPQPVMNHFFGPVSVGFGKYRVVVELNKVQMTNCISFLEEDANGVTELREALIDVARQVPSS